MPLRSCRTPDSPDQPLDRIWLSRRLAKSAAVQADHPMSSLPAAARAIRFLAGEDLVHRFADQTRPVVPCSAVGHVHPSPAEQRNKQHEQVGDAVALAFVVDHGGPIGPDRARGPPFLRLLL